ncbi:MAG: indole-3-glycerol-phosphate synthase [Deltaproteobacteria bacterium]|nr:indole-3-glycerol-phosphate synthase [Deltaproteobacteria bacterium]
MPPPVGLRPAFAWAGFSVIAEIKRASPSKGPIADHPVKAWAQGLERGGAAMLSVLTERTYFHGNLETLGEVAAAVKVPLLRKDFLLAPFELDEAVAFGASAVLLIVAFAGAELPSLYREARARGLSVLMEVHHMRELDAAFACSAFSDDATMLGVNQRDLESLAVDPRFAERLVPRLPRGCRFVVESGIAGPTDLAWARSIGASGVLVGEALAKTADPGATLAGWLAA